MSTIIDSKFKIFKFICNFSCLILRVKLQLVSEMGETFEPIVREYLNVAVAGKTNVIQIMQIFKLDLTTSLL